MTREQLQTERVLELARLVAEARPEQIKRLLNDIKSSGEKTAG